MTTESNLARYMKVYEDLRNTFGATTSEDLRAISRIAREIIAGERKAREQRLAAISPAVRHGK